MSNRKSVLKMSAKEARTFFLKPTSYVPFPMPEYFNFNAILQEAKDLFKGINDIHAIGGKKMKNYENLNHTMFMNKNGNYDWRPITIVHPLAYVGLVYFLTSNDHWQQIKERFSKFQQNNRIKCISIPVESTGVHTDKEETILNWWENLEQASIKNALTYQYCIKTDITNCYGSIYTHSIAWALEGKNEAKKDSKGKPKLFGNKLDERIREIQFGQTNGILQAGEIYNLIAEIVLGYSDFKLDSRLNTILTSSEKNDYQIIRYRDDYRIFSNSKETAEKITKELAEVLTLLNMHFNQKKTGISTDIIKTAIKPDKMYWLSRDLSMFTINNKRRKYQLSLQKHLWLIKDLSDKFPNSGSVTKALNTFYHRIKMLKPKESEIPQLISLINALITNSPKSIPQEVLILDYIFSKQKADDTKKYIKQILNNVRKKPNTEYVEIWLQQLSIRAGDEKNSFEGILTKKVLRNTPIWNSDWCNKEFDESPLIDSDKVNKNSKLSEKGILLFTHNY